MPKKINIAPSIYRDEETGILYIRYKNERGQGKWKSTKGKDMSTAKALRDKLKEERRQRGLDLKKSEREERRLKMTLSELIERYRPEFEAKGSARDDKRFAKFWKRELGRERIHDILPYDIEGARRDKLLTGVKPATVNRHTSFLRIIFNKAIRDYLMESNPCGSKRVPPLNEDGVRERLVTFQEEVLFPTLRN